MPTGVRSEACSELQAIVTGIEDFGLFHEEKLTKNMNPDEAYGQPYEMQICMCDFTVASYQVAMTVDWQALTQCDMGNLVCLARTTAKKSKPMVLFSAGCGENTGRGEGEATDKQMSSKMKKMGLSTSTTAEFIAVLLSLAGPEFLPTYSSSGPFDVETWAVCDKALSASMRLEKLRPSGAQ